MVYWLDTRWTIVFEPGGGDFLLLLPAWTSPWSHPAMFTVGNGPFSWENSSQDMELITHPNLELILWISTAIPLLLLCAAIGMLLSDHYFLHVCGWLFMNSDFMYWDKRKATDNKSVKSYEFTETVCFLLSVSSYWEIAKRAQLNVLFQNITLLFFYL